MTLPAVADEGAYEAIRRDDSLFTPAVLAACVPLGVAEDVPIVRFTEGSLPVYAVGAELVVKLYPPYDAAHANTEAWALVAVQGRLPLATPRVLTRREQDGWSLLVMSRLAGRSLAVAWPEMDADDQLRIADQLGAAVGALRALEVEAGSVAQEQWDTFLAHQRGSAVERQRQLGLGAPWVEAIEPYLEPFAEAPTERLVLLHTEIMRAHLLVDRDAAGWRLTGLFDFEPAMVGHPEYELASLALFVACGDHAFLRRCLRAAGHREDELGPELGRRIMGYTLLHRYSSLPWYLRLMPPAPGVTTFEGLAAQWFGL